MILDNLLQIINLIINKMIKIVNNNYSIKHNGFLPYPINWKILFKLLKNKKLK